MNMEEACCVLGVAPEDATPATVRTAYRRLALRHHPDKNPGREEESKEAFQRLSNAYKTTLTHLEGGHGDLNWRGRRPPASSGSEAEASWEEAKDLFRQTFGMDFDDAARVGVAMAAEVASELSSVASSMLVESGRRVSEGMALNESKISMLRGRVDKARRDLGQARDRHGEAVREYESFLRDPRIEFEEVPEKLSVVLALVATSALCEWIGSSAFVVVAGFIAFFVAVQTMGNFVSYLSVYEKQRSFFQVRVTEAARNIRAQETVHEGYCRALVEAESPVNQSLNIIGSLLGLAPALRPHTPIHETEWSYS